MSQSEIISLEDPHQVFQIDCDGSLLLKVEAGADSAETKLMVAAEGLQNQLAGGPLIIMSVIILCGHICNYVFFLFFFMIQV